MDELIRLFNLLHDGWVAEKHSAKLRVEIQYVAEHAGWKADWMELHWHRPVELRWEAFDGQDAELVEATILSAEAGDEGIRVLCATAEGHGYLHVPADEIPHLTSANGPLSLEELEAISDSYWTEWEERAKAARRERE